ncbi:hypothetical protein IMZ48_07650 [Candidatus Bathyarchaeota archaeon]|nr:hypothetical protein [Candidatus Bathyarchaeota archaeon]
MMTRGRPSKLVSDGWRREAGNGDGPGASRVVARRAIRREQQADSFFSRAAVRVRPPLKSSDPGFDLIPQRFQRSMVHLTSDTNLTIDSPQGKKLFVFDRVFGEETEQDGVWDYVSECVDSFLQGYNVSLLAYGQSGAGKSYTMGTSGPLEQSDVSAMGRHIPAMRASTPVLTLPLQVLSPAPRRPSSRCSTHPNPPQRRRTATPCPSCGHHATPPRPTSRHPPNAAGSSRPPTWRSTTSSSATSWSPNTSPRTSAAPYRSAKTPRATSS